MAKKDKFQQFLDTFPRNLQDTTSYDMRLLSNYVTDFRDAVRKGYITFDPEDNTYHGSSVVYDEDKDEYLFLKNNNHPSYNKEVDWYNSDEATDFRKIYDFIPVDASREGYSKYQRKQKEESIEKFKGGGEVTSKIGQGSLVIKSGVIFEELDPVLQQNLMEYANRGVNIRITSGKNDFSHNPGSWHPKGMAVDITPIAGEDYETLLAGLDAHNDLKQGLTDSGYRFVDERRDTGKIWTGSHFHIGKDSKATPFIQIGSRLKTPRTIKEVDRWKQSGSNIEPTVAENSLPNVINVINSYDKETTLASTDLDLINQSISDIRTYQDRIKDLEVEVAGLRKVDKNQSDAARQLLEKQRERDEILGILQSSQFQIIDSGKTNIQKS